MHTVSARAHLYTYNKFLELRKLESSPIDHLILHSAEVKSIDIQYNSMQKTAPVANMLSFVL